MTYEQVKELQVSDIIKQTDLTKLTKQCLSIVDTSTLKDDEIKLFINAGFLDMKRQGIDVENKITDDLVQACIVMYVKANFGMCEIKEKDLAQQRYMQICNNLSLSSDYRAGDSNAWCKLQVAIYYFTDW